MNPNKYIKTACGALILILIAAPSLLALSCSSGEKAGGKIGVVVTLPPQAYFVKKLAGDKADVTVMVPSGASPHTYEPAPSQMTAVAKADMYAKVGSGVEFELVWLDKLLEQNNNLLVVDCSEGIQILESVADEHPDNGELDHEMDPHIWMSPIHAVFMVQNICNGLMTIDPANVEYYRQNRDILIEELVQVDRYIRNSLFDVTNRNFMVYHPAFGYFAKEYDLTMIPIEEEGKEPTASGLTHLIEQAEEYNINVIFASPQFDPRSAGVIADEIGGTVIFIDAMAEDYVTNLRTLADQLAESME